MTGFKIIEDRPTPKEVYNLRIYLLAAICGAGAVTFGYDGAFIGTTIARASFKKAMGIDKLSSAQQTANSSNLTSAFTGAAFFGAVTAWPIMEAWGRKRPMQVSAFLFNLGALLMTVTTHSLDMIYAGRVITGFSVGILTAVIPTFLSELSPPPIRGTLTGLFEVAYQIGSLCGFWINYGISQHQDPTQNKSWRIAMAVQLIPGGLLAVGSVVLKESPGWLLRKGREEQALQVLSYIRKLPADAQYIHEEVALLRLVIEEERQIAGDQKGVWAYLRGAIRTLRIRSIRFRFAVEFAIFILMNFSGAVVLNYYSPKLFGAIGLKGDDILLYTGIYGLVKAIGAIGFCFWLVDRVGRRKPWLVSATGCAICLFYIGAYVAIAEPERHPEGLSSSSVAGGKAAVAAIMIYSWFWSWGGNSLAWIVSAEMFPISLRSISGSFGASTQWLSSTAATLSAPYMADSIGYGMFLLYGACCVLTAIFTFFFIPETKGIPVECMGQLFDGPSRFTQFRQKRVFPPHGVPPTIVDTVETAGEEKEEVSEKEYA